ncbi:MAG: hypothetical protein JXA10_10350 [Anaerolineae bacterium]|nr:hypothetical protein [Anaerolineae bacterium]
MLVEKIGQLLQACSTDAPYFPPTELYNDEWLLRLVLDWFATHDAPDHALCVAEGAHWFAEARLPTNFTKRHTGDNLAERRTQVDGVIGHFKIAHKGEKAQLTLKASAQQFVVLEAKLFSLLSGGIKVARYFDQAARTVACMAEALSQADRYPVDMDRIGFYVIAPRLQIERGTFADYLSRESLRRKVKQRIKAYDDKKKRRWYSEWADPTIEQIRLDALSWETLIAYIGAQDAVAGPALADFYERCIQYNVNVGERNY